MPPTLLRPLGFGEILDGAFSLYRAHFALLFTTALIATLPVPLASLLFAGDPQQMDAAPLRMLALAAVMGLATLLGWGALTWQVGQAVLGRPLSTATALRRAVGALAPLVIAGVLGYSILMVVGVLALFAVLVVVVPLSLLLPGVAPIVAVAVGGAVGLALVAGMAAVLFAVPAAVVLESRGPLTALQRSWRLAADSRLKVLGVVVVSWLIVILPSIGLVALGAGAGLAGVGLDGGASPFWRGVEAAMGLLIGALTYPFMVGAVTVLYFERRVRIEALDLELAAEELAAGV